LLAVTINHYRPSIYAQYQKIKTACLYREPPNENTRTFLSVALHHLTVSLAGRAFFSVTQVSTNISSLRDLRKSSLFSSRLWGGILVEKNRPPPKRVFRNII